MRLERFCYSSLGTFGRFLDGDFKSFTMEEVWQQNKTSISCIPEGRYLCKRRSFPTHGPMFEVTNVSGRTAILIHIGNTIADVEGCICPGEKLGAIDGMWAVLDSQTAYDRFMQHMDGVDEFTLEVMFNSGYLWK